MAEKSLERVGRDRREALAQINDRFGIGDSVKQLQWMMREVTRQDVTADTVHAACNCVGKINDTIKTTIQAAKFLADK